MPISDVSLHDVGGYNHHPAVSVPCRVCFENERILINRLNNHALNINHSSRREAYHGTAQEIGWPWVVQLAVFGLLKTTTALVP